MQSAGILRDAGDAIVVGWHSCCLHSCSACYTAWMTHVVWNKVHWASTLVWCHSCSLLAQYSPGGN